MSTDVRAEGLVLTAQDSWTPWGCPRGPCLWDPAAKLGGKSSTALWRLLEMLPKQRRMLSTDGDGERGSNCHLLPPHRKAPWRGFMEKAPVGTQLSPPWVRPHSTGPLSWALP